MENFTRAFTVSGNVITDSKPTKKAGNAGENIVTSLSFTFSSEWDNAIKSIVFKTPKNRLLTPQTITGSIAPIPQDALDSGGTLQFSLMGAFADSNKVLRTPTYGLDVESTLSILGGTPIATYTNVVLDCQTATQEAITAKDAALLATERIETTDAEIKAAELIREVERLKWTNATAQATTLEPDELAAASVTDGETGKIFNIGVPRGIQGIQGIQGIAGEQGIQGPAGGTWTSAAAIPIVDAGGYYLADNVEAALQEAAKLPKTANDLTTILNVDYTIEYVGPELVANSNLDLWTGEIPNNIYIQDGTGSHAKETSIIRSGLASLSLTRGSSPAWYDTQAYQNVAVTPGKTYELSLWTRGDGTNSGTFAIFNNTAPGYIKDTTTLGISGTTFTKFVSRFTTPSGCVSVKLWLFPKNVNGAKFYIDDISLRQVDTLQGNGEALNLQSVLQAFPAKTVRFDNSNTGMTSTTVQAAIKEAFDHAFTFGQNPRIILPDGVTAVVGDKLQLFVRGMVEAMNPYNLPYELMVSGSNTAAPALASYPRYLEYSPAAGDTGVKTFTITVRDLNYNVIATDTMNITVVNPTSAPATNKNILCIGDSLTSAGVWPAELYRRLTQTGGVPAGKGYGNITFVGDKPLPGYETQGFIGWGGWTWDGYIGITGTTQGHVLTGTFDKDRSDVGATYTDGVNNWIIDYATGGLKVHGTGTLAESGALTYVSGGTHTSNIVYTAKTDEPQSPLWTTGVGRFSFADWANRIGIVSLDEVCVLLGWNGLAIPNKYQAADHAYMIGCARTFLDKLHSDFPNCKVRLMGIQVPSINGGLGNNYGSMSDFSKFYSMLRSVNGLRLAYQALANEAAYSSFVTYIDNAVQFDSEWNLPYGLTAVNSRSSVTENLGKNGVHPQSDGYYQIADAVYRDFIKTFCS